MSATGTGTTVTVVGNKPYRGDVQKMGGWTRSVPVLDDTHLGTTGYAEKCFGEIIEHGTIRMEVLTSSEQRFLPVLKDIQSWTIKYADGSTISGTAAIVESVTSDEVVNQRRLETFDLQFDGKTGPTLFDGRFA